MFSIPCNSSQMAVCNRFLALTHIGSCQKKKGNKPLYTGALKEVFDNYFGDAFYEN